VHNVLLINIQAQWPITRSKKLNVYLDLSSEQAVACQAVTPPTSY